MALRVLGEQYDSGELLEQDDQKALEYFRKAADQDDTISKIEVGKYYYFGIGVGEDDAEAVKWFEQAISDDERSLAEDKMHSIGGECYRLLGECYLKGYGVEEDLDKAVELLETGSHLDDDHAQYLLGVCYAGGLGVSQDPEEAFELFLASALEENQNAIEEVIRCYRNGVGIAQDLVEAEDWLSKLEEPHGDEEKYERAVERQALQGKVKTNNLPRTAKALGGENVIPFPNQANRDQANKEEALQKSEERVAEQIKKEIDVGDLIQSGEGMALELKSSARFDTKLNERNDDLELGIMKTVAGFLNKQGGQLIIGVANDGKSIGLDPDYGTFKKQEDRNRDGYERYIWRLLQNTLSEAAILESLQISFQNRDGNDICIIEVKPSEHPVFVKLEAKRKIENKNLPKEKNEYREVLFVRAGNKTEPLYGNVMSDYLFDHFEGYKRLK